jgi:NAD(P)-dependent dehydrogenase (short-subunit alcohol dehydrogenase family)
MLWGKIAVVTGGVTGIGAATTRALARQGAHVVIASHLTPEAMAPVHNPVIAAAGSVSVATCNVADRAQVQALMERIAREHARLDIVVNCAGVFFRTPAFEDPGDKIETMFAVNALGAIHVTLAALPLLRESGGGSIVNVTSAAARLGPETYAAYSASKAALAHFTRTLAPELRRTGIRINAVAPGSVRTAMLGFQGESLNLEQLEMLRKREAASNSPDGRAMSEPDDIAQLILFLASDASRSIHGASIVADQGQTAALFVAH